LKNLLILFIAFLSLLTLGGEFSSWIPDVDVGDLPPPYIRFTDPYGRPVVQYVVGDRIFILVHDPGENKDPTARDSLPQRVTLKVIREDQLTQAIRANLIETTPDSGVFLAGPVSTGPPGGGAQLEVTPGDILRAEYTYQSYYGYSNITWHQEIRIWDKLCPPPASCFLFNKPNPLSTQTAFKVIRKNPDGTEAFIEIEKLSVRIFNLQGRLVFAQEVFDSQLTWEGIDEAGYPLGNGTYLYLMTAWGFNGEVLRSGIRKLAVLR